MNKAGDTITGVLKITNALAPQGTESRFYQNEAGIGVIGTFVDGVAINYITFPRSGGMGVVSPGSIQIGSTVIPTADSLYDLGNTSRKWNNIFATTGTINTSDERQKKDISALDNIDGFFMALNPAKCRYKDGTSGRTHHVLIAQEVESAMLANGISDMNFAGLIKSPVYKEEYRDTERGTEEIPIEEREIVGYVYGLRYSEFIPMLIKMVQDQQWEIDELKAAL